VIRCSGFGPVSARSREVEVDLAARLGFNLFLQCRIQVAADLPSFLEGSQGVPALFVERELSWRGTGAGPGSWGAGPG
jgi:hypothetical protein